MLKRIVLGLVAAVAAFSLSIEPADARPLAEIQKSGVLRVGVNPTLPPLGIYNDKNEIDGFDVEFSRKVAEMLGVELEVVQVGSPDRIPFVSTGKIDYVMGAMTRLAFGSGTILVSRRICPQDALDTRISRSRKRGMGRTRCLECVCHSRSPLNILPRIIGVASLTPQGPEAPVPCPQEPTFRDKESQPMLKTYAAFSCRSRRRAAARGEKSACCASASLPPLGLQRQERDDGFDDRCQSRDVRARGRQVGSPDRIPFARPARSTT